MALRIDLPIPPTGDTTNPATKRYFELLVAGINDYLDESIVSDWTSFTPTGGWNTNVTYTGKYRRVGDTMEVQFKIACTGAPNNVAPTIVLPGSNTIDTAKLLGTTADESPIDGIIEIVDTGTAFYTGRVMYKSTTDVRFRFQDDAAAGVILTTINGNTAPFSYGNGDYIQGYFRVPITGW